MGVQSYKLRKLLGILRNKVTVGAVLLTLLFVTASCVSAEEETGPDVGGNPEDVA